MSELLSENALLVVVVFFNMPLNLSLNITSKDKTFVAGGCVQNFGCRENGLKLKDSEGCCDIGRTE